MYPHIGTLELGPFTLGLLYVLLVEDMSFSTKKDLSSEDAKKCPNVLLFGIKNSENTSNHSSTKNLGKLTLACERNDLFLFGLHLILRE